MIDSRPLNFHRDPLKSLLADVISVCNISRDEGKVVIKNMLMYVETKIWDGEDLDLGVFRLKQVKKSPIQINSKLKTAKGNYFIGERLKWKLTVSKGWEKRTKPPWSNV